MIQEAALRAWLGDMRRIWRRGYYAQRILGTRITMQLRCEDEAAKYRAMAAAFYEDGTISARQYVMGLCAK